MVNLSKILAKHIICWKIVDVLLCHCIDAMQQHLRKHCICLTSKCISDTDTSTQVVYTYKRLSITIFFVARAAWGFIPEASNARTRISSKRSLGFGPFLAPSLCFPKRHLLICEFAQLRYSDIKSIEENLPFPDIASMDWWTFRARVFTKRNQKHVEISRCKQSYNTQDTFF